MIYEKDAYLREEIFLIRILREKGLNKNTLVKKDPGKEGVAMPVRYYRRNVKPIISQAANIQRGERWLVLVGFGQIEKNKKLAKGRQRQKGERREYIER